MGPCPPKILALSREDPVKTLRTFAGYEGDIEGDGEGCGGGGMWEDMEVNMVDGSVCLCGAIQGEKVGR